MLFGSFAVGGADSYGYVDQAYEWKAGRLPEAISLGMTLALPDADEIQIPLGYRRGQAPHTMVPTYAPGLPFIMAFALFFGACGPFYVVPICSALLVWFTYRLGTKAGGPLTGAMAALIVTVTPVVLYQALWPMSDVPAGAFWTGAFVFAARARRLDVAIAACWVTLGLLVRPNLLPLAAVPLAAIAAVSPLRERWIRAALFSLPIAASAVFVAWLNIQWYGAASNTGYGATADIYLLRNVWPNVQLYAGWLWQSESPWVLTAALPLVPLLAGRVHRPTIWLCAAACVATFACYVTYSQFEVWWYLRFLIPAAGALAVLVASGLTAVARAVPQPYGRVAAITALWFMTATMLLFAHRARVFGPMQIGERRYVDIAELVDRELPPNAALFAMQHSGSLRFYSGRATLRYDWIKPDFAARVVPAVEQAGYHPYLVVDDFELAQVRRQFGMAPDVPLPWPIRARMREVGGITVFDMSPGEGAVTPVALEPGSVHRCAPRHAPTR